MVECSNNSQAKSESEEEKIQTKGLRKSNSINSMFISTTICKPNVDSMVRAVSTIIYSQMIEDQQGERTIVEDSDLFFFSEEKYIKEKIDSFDPNRIQLLRETPSVGQILDFMKALYDCAKFSPECFIIALVYINRLIAFTGLPLQPTNWRPLVLVSLLVAQKVWDDKYLSNLDFAFIYPFFSSQEINVLEKKFLELIQYNVAIKSTLYARYYFELRALFQDNDQEFPYNPLTNGDAEKLELNS